MNSPKIELEDIASALSHALEGQKLLDELYAEIGGYGNNYLNKSVLDNPDLLRKLNNYYKFDDSE
jgi:hypothetical protein